MSGKLDGMRARLMYPVSLSLALLTAQKMSSQRPVESGSDARAAAQRPRPQPAKRPPTSVSSCEVISLPGDYMLTGDLSTSLASCLSIAGITGVNLRCDGHAISFGAGRSVSNSDSVTIEGCASHPPQEAQGFGLRISNSSGVGVIGNNFENVDVENSTGTYLRGNSILGAYTQELTSFTLFLTNFVKAYNDRGSQDPVIAENGAHNSFLWNNIDGQWNGAIDPNTYAPVEIGADDGITLFYEDSDQIENNAIANTFDAGIESLGPLSNTLIVDNVIT